MQIFSGLLYRIIDKLYWKFILTKILLLKKQFKYCGEKVSISPNCSILNPGGLEIGDGSLIADFTMVFAGYGVSIGKGTLISSNCGISSINHDLESRDRVHSDFVASKPVKIGDNVWIGMNVCVLPGVVIGNDAMIAAGSVVTKEVPAGELWGGIPAKKLKSIDFKR
jgi:maltose O-acetyltransferase